MKLKIVTSNPGKVAEFREELKRIGIEVDHCSVDYDEVQTSDLEEVVTKGIDALRSEGLSNFVIDDTGLFIDALEGFPGVFSAYVQKTIGNDGILKLMENEDNRTAEFRTCIGCDIDGSTLTVIGVCKGTITKSEQGSEGFGYDPIFTHDGKRTFAELPLDEKNEVSHRGKGIRLLVEKLENFRPAETERK